ncbi:MAG: LysR family transcriptional regulator [Rubrivivax sp.]|nr:LysR family transcriptional regulator [Rubrivivax sp.]
MKIDTFATLDAVLRGGSFAFAAAEMHCTASAVSMQMKQLERYLGQPLFDRSGHQVRATALAHDVASALRAGLQQLQSLRRHAPRSVEGVVKLGVIESLLPVLLPGTLVELKLHYPQLELRPTRGRSADLTDAVKAGHLDAAVVAEPEQGGSARLLWHRLFRPEMRLIAPPTAVESSMPALFKQYDWIRYDRQTISGAMAARFVTGHVQNKRGTLELDSVPAIVALVSAGLGIAVVHLVDAGICQTHPVRFVRLGRAAPAVQMSLVTRKADADSRLLRALHEAMSGALAGTLRQRTKAGL